MKFTFVSDLHSNKSLYNALEKLIFSHKPDALIIGGDLFAYSPNVEPQLEFAKQYLCEFIKKINIPVHIITGNCDKPIAVKYLEKMQHYGLLNILTLKGTKINDIEFIGYNYTTPNPFKIKDWERRDLKEDSIVFEETCLLSDKMDKLYLVHNDFLNYLPSIEEELDRLNNKKSIWIMHAPPFGGILDKNYDNKCCGSKAIRAAIEHIQPILTLHGHIHESPSVSHKWSEKIGSTISINPGSSELLQAVIFEIDSDGNIIFINHTLYGELKF